MASLPDPNRNALKPFDWDHYEDEFRHNSAYALQEQALEEVFSTIQPDPTTVLEVGPGFGRITKYLVALWPEAKFALFDISEAAIEKTSLAIPDIDFAMAVGELQAQQYLPRHFPLIWPDTGRVDEAFGFDLVVCAEVMLHIPPNEVEFAARNLLAAVKPYGGHLITCDWTEALSPDREIRVQNYRHDYPRLFNYIGAKVIDYRRVGLQTIFVVQP